MTPDIEQHLELLVVTLVAILVVLKRLLRLSQSVKKELHLLTVSDTEQHSSESHPNTITSGADGRKTDSNAHKKQHTRRRENE